MKDVFVGVETSRLRYLFPWELVGDDTVEADLVFLVAKSSLAKMLAELVA